MPWSKLIDMEMDDEDKYDFCAPIACSKPDYPYGLRITLSDKELKKLGLSNPDIGDMLDMRCFATVTSCSVEKTDDGDRCRVELQIEKIAVENEMDEKEN